MRSAPSHLLDVQQHDGTGYRPLVDYDTWRVAILNFSPDLLPENLTRMQRHNETDEVFVLLAGKCILFVGAGTDSVTEIYATDLQPGRVYNVRHAVWHTHTLSEDAKVLVVENRDTTYDNSPFTPLAAPLFLNLQAMVKDLWGSPDPAMP